MPVVCGGWTEAWEDELVYGRKIGRGGGRRKVGGGGGSRKVDDMVDGR